jgi:hypothetical protein
MGLIAELKEGEFHYVETASSISECFADCLGGLVSLVADDIYITLAPAEGASIV